MRQFMDDTEVDGGVDSTEIRMRRRLVPSPSAPSPSAREAGGDAT
jgi:hypothetical protein